MFTPDFPRPEQSHRTARRRGAVLLAAATVTAAAAVATSVPAQAAGGKGGGRAVHASSPCATGTLRLKAKHDAPVLDVGAQLETGVAGQAWTVTFTDNGVLVWTGSLTTAPVGGGFGVARPMPDQATADVITVQAVLGTTVCSATVTL